MYDDYDRCYECRGYGDDYFVNDDGKLERFCPYCMMHRDDSDDWYDNDDWYD